MVVFVPNDVLYDLFWSKLFPLTCLELEWFETKTNMNVFAGLKGIGVDMVHTKRVIGLYNNYGDKYLNKALHVNEIQKFKSLQEYPMLQQQYLATMYKYIYFNWF